MHSEMLNPQDRAQAGERPHPVQEASGGDMAWIEGGSFTMGSDHHYPEEAPVHRVSVTVSGWIVRP